MQDNYKIIRYRWRYFFIIQVVIAFVICLSENFWLKNQNNTCIIDGVGLIMNGAVFLILYVINLLYVINIINNKNDIQVLLRFGNRKMVLKEDVKQIFIINGITSIIWGFWGLISGRLHSNILNNWNNFNSFFSQETTSAGTGICNMSEVVIVLISLIAIMLLLDVISLFMYLCVLVTNNIYIGVIFILGTGFLDTWIIKKPIFIKRFLIYGDSWLSIERIILNIIIMMILLISMIMIGVVLIDGKEFYANEQRE